MIRSICPDKCNRRPGEIKAHSRARLESKHVGTIVITACVRQKFMKVMTKEKGERRIKLIIKK